MKLTRISCPIHEYDVRRFTIQTIANARQQQHTTSETIEVSPRRGKFTFFSTQSLHLLLIKQER